MSAFGFLIFVVLVFVFVLAVFVINASRSEKIINGNVNKVQEHLNSLKDFSYDPTNHLYGAGGLHGIALDKDNRRICLFAANGDVINSRVIPWGTVIGVEVIHDGDSISKVSRGSQIGGAAVGGLLFGGLGAVVGGLTGNSVSSTRIQQLSLRITVNDLDSPLFSVLLLNLPEPKEKTDQTCRSAMLLADEWTAKLRVILAEGSGASGAA